MSGDCVFDDVKNRVLNGYYFSSEEMTVEFCIATCSEMGYDYAGLEWNIECYCGNKPARGFDWAWLDKCDENVPEIRNKYVVEQAPCLSIRSRVSEK